MESKQGAPISYPGTRKDQVVAMFHMCMSHSEGFFTHSFPQLELLAGSDVETGPHGVSLALSLSLSLP